jgi:hypothetical protein
MLAVELAEEVLSLRLSKAVEEEKQVFNSAFAAYCAGKIAPEVCGAVRAGDRAVAAFRRAKEK